MAFNWNEGKAITKEVLPKKEISESIKEFEAAGLEAEKSREFLEKPFQKQILTGKFAAKIPSGIAETVLGTPAKFIASALEVPEMIGKKLGGEEFKAVQRKYDLPFLSPFNSYISQAETRAKEIIEEATGERAPSKIPWQARILQPFAEVPLAGLETAVLIKGAIKIGEKGISTFGEISQQKRLNQALEETMPELTKKEATTVLRAGRGKKAGVLKTIEVEPTSQDINRAKATVGIVRKGDPIGNEVRLQKEIERISEEVITPHLQKNPAPFRMQDLKGSLTKTQPESILTKRDITLKNAYDSVKEGIISELDIIQPKTTYDLWEARKALDIVFEREVGTRAWTDVHMPAATEAYRDMRRTINAFIANRTPGTTYKDGLSKLSYLYDAAENIATKNWRLLGTNILTRLWKMHPTFRVILKYVVPGGLIGAGIGSKFR